MTVMDIILTILCISIAALTLIIWRGLDNIYSYLETIYYTITHRDAPDFPVSDSPIGMSPNELAIWEQAVQKGDTMEQPQIEGDTRAEDIQNARGDKIALGTFYITDNGRGVEFALLNPDYLDIDTFATCMVQLIAHSMNQNPEVGQMTIMTALQQAMMRAMADDTEEDTAEE